MKKILFILPWLKLGGLERVQVNIANALAEREYDVTVMTLNPENDLKAELSDKVHYVYKPYKPHPIMRRIPYIRHKFYDDGMWETRALAKKLYRYYVGNEKYDVEIGFFRGLSIKIISGSTNKNSVKLAWVHSDFRKAVGYKNNFKNMQGVKNAYAKFDKVVCVSNEAQDGFKAVIGDTGNLTTIYNLLPVKNIVSLSQQSCIEIKDKFTVLAVGHLEAVKGYDRLLNVVKRLNDSGYDFDLWIIGFGSEENHLKAVIDQNKLKNVQILGYKSNPYPYMKQADLYVCSSRYEGYNLTVAEALILGTPVLSTDCAGPNEILDKGEYGVIVPNSEEGLCQGIKALLDNPEKMQYYKMKACERLDFFDEGKIVGKIEKLFNKNV
ncbi:MAG: glycosyltransferase [Clostridia bacterium]|nr:glycosyltransferase [Clostridia bacterium]